jgi:hypothetical protein
MWTSSSDSNSTDEDDGGTSPNSGLKIYIITILKSSICGYLVSTCLKVLTF